MLLKLAGKTLADEQQNDLIKKNLAEKNGYVYIVIDCRESSVDWIRNSIMNSQLPTLLGFNEHDIDWNKCGLDAAKSIKKNVWDYYNKYYFSVKELAEIVGLANVTVNRYLIEGNQLGICKYDQYFERYGSPLQAIKDGEILFTARNSEEMTIKYNNYTGSSVTKAAINSYISNRNKNPHGFTFKRITDRERRREILYGDS